MSEHQTQAAQEEAAKKNQPDESGNGGAPAKPPGSEQEKDALIKKLQAENAQLKQQVADLQKTIQQYESEAKAAKNRVRAEKLVKKLEKKGFAFGDDDARTAEVDRLAGLSDEAFAAAEQTYDRLPSTTKSDEKKQPETKADNRLALSAAADVRPQMVDDTPVTIQEQLRQGIQAAYNHSCGKETED